MCVSTGVRARAGHERASSRLLQDAVQGESVRPERLEPETFILTDAEVLPPQVRVPEDTAPWKDILQLSAQDVDANSNLLYSIHNRREQDSTRLFHLDPKSGVLVLKEELDYETAAVHTLIVMVPLQGAGTRIGSCRGSVSDRTFFLLHSSGQRPGGPGEEELC